MRVFRWFFRFTNSYIKFGKEILCELVTVRDVICPAVERNIHANVEIFHGQNLPIFAGNSVTSDKSSLGSSKFWLSNNKNLR